HLLVREAEEAAHTVLVGMAADPTAMGQAVASAIETVDTATEGHSETAARAAAIASRSAREVAGGTGTGIAKVGMDVTTTLGSAATKATAMTIPETNDATSIFSLHAHHRLRQLHCCGTVCCKRVTSSSRIFASIFFPFVVKGCKRSDW